MEFDYYQREARETDQYPKARKGRLIALLGLASEAADLLGEEKKRLRDGRSHTTFMQVIKEELGDVLWYLSTTATHHGFALDDIARSNLEKIRRRWIRKQPDHLFKEQDYFDHGYPSHERFPRKFSVRFDQFEEGKRTSVKLRVRKPALGTFSKKKQPRKVDGLYVIGNELTDNAYKDDGYRFHDVFHLAHAAVLGWSPVLRMLLGRKRKDNPKVDEVEDGARAIFTEEALLTVVFNYARQKRFLNKVKSVDTKLLDMIASMVSGLEVHQVPAAEWERAILAGYEVFRELKKKKRGWVHVDMAKRAITFDEA